MKSTNVCYKSKAWGLGDLGTWGLGDLGTIYLYHSDLYFILTQCQLPVVDRVNNGKLSQLGELQ